MSIQFFKKAATNPFVKADSGGIVIRGIDTGYSTEAPTFSTVIAAGGNSATATLNSGNAAQFEFIRMSITDSLGNGGGGVYAGIPLVIDTTNVSKSQNSSGPDASIEVVYKLVGQEQVLSYSVNLDAATLVAGATINTLLRLDSDDRGAYIAIDSITYDGTLGAEETVIRVENAIGLVGFTLTATIDGGSATTAVVDNEGDALFTIAGIRIAGAHAVKVYVTTAGDQYNSFQTGSFTV